MTDDYQFPHEQYILVGKVAKPHGLQGEIKIYAYSDDAETLLHYKNVVLVDSKGRLFPELRIEKARFQGKIVVFKLETINDRNSAEAVHGMGILVKKDDLQDVNEGEYYWYQFHDLPVYTEQGQKLGTVVSIFSNGAQDIMVVQQEEDEFLIPILDSIIKEHTDESIIIAPPPGLLEINTRASE